MQNLNINPSGLYILQNLPKNAVQTTWYDGAGTGKLFALQYNEHTGTSIYESTKEIDDPNYIDANQNNNVNFPSKPYLNIFKNKNNQIIGGHTQTLIVNSGLLFTGINDKNNALATINHGSKIDWAKNIGVFRYNSNENATKNAKNGYYVTITGLPNKKGIHRVELAANPACNYLMLAINDKADNLHLYFYNYDNIAYPIDNKLADNNWNPFNIPNVKPKSVIPYNDLCAANDTKDFSFQGFALDNSQNVYLTSGFAPNMKINNLRLKDNNNIFFFPADHLDTKHCTRIHIDHNKLINYLENCQLNITLSANAYFEIEGIQAFDNEGNGGNNCLVNVDIHDNTLLGLKTVAEIVLKYSWRQDDD